MASGEPPLRNTNGDVGAVVVAAGRGARAGGGVPKQYRKVGGVTLLEHAVRRLRDHPAVRELVVVIAPDADDWFAPIAARMTPPPPHVYGGASRADSVRAGLDAMSRSVERVLIHDAARPFPTRAMMDASLDGLTDADAAIPALPVADTLKRAGADGRVLETPPREGLFRAQTPQAFRLSALRSAFKTLAADASRFTDEAGLMEAAGAAVVLTPGSESAFKVTLPEDFERAEHMANSMETRTGQGFDVHAFGPGDAVILCGVSVPHDKGLSGHSDADVALHTVTDALFGALGAGDIGMHFPPSDPQWKGAPSRIFLEKAVDMVAARGGRIINVDLTIIGEEPKIGPHRDQLETSLAEMLRVPKARVCVKATTTERLGFPGRREGLAALAVSTLELPRENDVS